MSVKKPLSYWQKRADTRMYEYQKQADAVADDIAKAYINSTNYINKQMHDIFNAFVTKNKLSEAEARRLLKNLPDDATLADLKAAVRRIEDESAKEELIKQIDSPAYAHRIGRLEALQKDIDKQTASLAKFEQNITKQHYTSLLPEAFMKTMFDTQKRAGFIFSFAKMPKSRINEILRQNWSGKIFSERIWDREKNINQTLKNELLVSFMTGRSYNKTAKEIENKMASSAYAARRLVRTESAYISNMADMESYKAAGIEKYKFLATLDLRTSDICQSMDGKVFKVSEALCGTNLPPMHTYCRSTTVSFADDKAKKNMKKRIARNPETGKVYYVDENMTYEQWEKSIDDISGEGTFEKRRAMHKALRGDTEQFERYKKVLGADNLPKDIDSFQNLKYNDKEKYGLLKRQYRIVNMYEVYGAATTEKILALDNVAWTMRQEGFDFSSITGNEKKSTRKRLKKSGNVASMHFDSKTYFSHSAIGKPGSLENSLYIGKYPLVELRANRLFKVKPLGDGVLREYDTEAKFLEFAATVKKPEDVFTIDILSEKHICESCQGVVKQFKQMFPKATVNIISGKRGYNNSPEGLKTWKHRKKW